MTRALREHRGAIPLAALALGAGVLALLHVGRGLAYWDYSEGVYALTSRLLLEGHGVYRHVVAAQPPGMFAFGATALAIHDGLDWLRLVVGAAQLLAGLLGARIVWRLTDSAAAAVIAPALTLLTPWAVHEHGALTPELLAPPLLLGATLLAARGRTLPAGACLAALTPFIKWPFVLPALAIALLSPQPARALRWGLATLLSEAALATALFGDGLWRMTVLAQLHSGARGAHMLLGVLGQAGWSLLGLLVAAGAAIGLRRGIADDGLLRLLLGVALGLLATVATTIKAGTGLNVLVPVEAVLVPLALTGLVLGLRTRRVGRGWLPAAVAAGGLLFTLVQTAALLTAAHTRSPFLYPTSHRGAWQRADSDARVRAIVRGIARCPSALPYGGPPYLAFLARRSMPDDQPDQYLTTHSSTLRAVARRIAAAPAVCPAGLG